MAFFGITETLVYQASLVLSAIVLVFWVSYSLILFHQHKHGVVRKDWWLSMIFYVGIGLLVLGNLLLAFSHLFNTDLGRQISIVLSMLSMLVFIFAFRMRMKTALGFNHDVKVTKSVFKKR